MSRVVQERPPLIGPTEGSRWAGDCRTLLAESFTAPAGRTADALAALLADGGLDLPLPGSGDTAHRWSRLAAWGRADLPLARLAEGHTDALAVLAELGAPPARGARYGVWAARSGGTGAELTGGPGQFAVSGRVRFCSGASDLDRALVVAAAPGGSRIVDLDLSRPGIRRDPDSWDANAMRASDTLDVHLDRVEVDVPLGEPDRYTARPGFWWGGAGVAAVWLGGAAGVVDVLHERLRGSSDPHKLAHLGALHAALQAADALLVRTAELIDADPRRAHRTPVRVARAVVEDLCRTVLDRAPRAAGVTGLVDGLADRLADLGMYVRQHHGEADLAAIGAELVETEGR